MKFQNICIFTFTAFSLCACALTANKSIKREPLSAFILEEQKNIDAEPETKHNTARLLKHSDYCEIEFIAQLKSGTAKEQWIFKDERLLSAFTHISTSTNKTQTIFDPSQEQSQTNLKALKSNFSSKNLQQCNFE